MVLASDRLWCGEWFCEYELRTHQLSDFRAFMYAFIEFMCTVQQMSTENAWRRESQASPTDNEPLIYCYIFPCWWLKWIFCDAGRNKCMHALVIMRDYRRIALRRRCTRMCCNDQPLERRRSSFNSRTNWHFVRHCSWYSVHTACTYCCHHVSRHKNCFTSINI